MHGHFSPNIDEKLVGNEWSYQWWKFGDIKGETGSSIVAAQVQAHTILKINFEGRNWQ